MARAKAPVPKVIFASPALAAAMSVQRRLLVDNRSRDGHAINMAEQACRRLDRRQGLDGNTKDVAEHRIPVQCL